MNFEGWILTAPMDVIDVSIWKREQEAKGSFSMRELVSKKDVIASTLSRQIQESDHVYTHMFAHAVIIRAYTVTSGYSSDIPEIQQTLDMPLRCGRPFIHPLLI
ncbi:putative C6 transcription factor [Seiridium cardinale]